MTSRDAFVSAMIAMWQREGATPERLASSDVILTALGASSGEEARERLLQLADEHVSRNAKLTGRTGNSRYDYFMRIYGLDGFGGMERGSTLDDRLETIENRDSGYTVAPNTAKKGAVQAIGEIADALGLVNSGSQDPVDSSSNRADIATDIELPEDPPDQAVKANRISYRYWASVYMGGLKRFVGRHLTSVFACIICMCAGLSVGIYLISSDYNEAIEGAVSGSGGNRAVALSHADFAGLTDMQQIDACSEIIRARRTWTWNQWLEGDFKPVGTPSYPDEQNPTPNGLLNLTSVVLKVIEEERDTNVAQNLASCAYAPGTPAYHEAISLIASRKLLAPRCSNKDQKFIEPIRQEHPWRSIERHPEGAIDYERVQGEKSSIWRVGRIRYPLVQDGGLDGTFSWMCEPLVRN